MTLGSEAISMALSMISTGVTHGAAGAVYQSYFVRKKLVNAKFHNGVGLSAADFHDGPGTSGDARNGGGKLTDRVGFAIFVDELHAPVSNSRSSSIWRK